MLFTAALAALVGAAAAKDGRTFAVLRFHGDGPLTTGRVDPVVQPGQISSHVHTVMGASNFGMNSTGDDLRQSSCTTALIKGDLSAYWYPQLYFQDPKDGHFEPVELFYMNIYYFFEGTNDEIKAFPVGLQMVSGNAMTRDPPNKDGSQNLDPSKGPVNPLQWTCPRKSYDPPSWPAGSDGTTAGIQSANNKGSGIGFPLQKCDGYASPLRMDLHFPSCYNPAAGLTNYKENMAFPSSTGNGKQDCPSGWIHVPHIFFEVYWNTPKFDARWTPDGKTQPFRLANGDVTGYSGHGDMIAGWDEKVLQQIIDNCDAGDSGMDKCPGLIGGLNKDAPSCNIPSPVNEQVDGILTKLPGNNPLSGFGFGSVPAMSGSPAVDTPAVSSASSPAAASSSKPASSSKTAESSKTTAVNQVKAPSPVAPTPDTTSAAMDSSADAQPTDAPATSSDSTSTVWETVTQWNTATVTAGSATAAPTTTGSPQTVNGTDATLPDIAGFKYAGCFKDSRDRALAGEVRPNLGEVSNTKCVAYCKGKGWALAGTEYGGQCYCGNSLTGSELIDEASCDTACEGAAGETCGGGWALSVYSADGSATVVSKVKRHAHNHLAFHRRGPSARRR
ncbi:WSC-domain-containing protein [Coniochaeta hoffmannii]|uniref:WSC-domain-containing protein n=1 Tax=Coniochaeta hoffmannii TaxID=91930 RepID=A0AA38VZ20_9PEZI|nr:WSC-domain-containing protein [Coniochaeta hoffmannii]